MRRLLAVGVRESWEGEWQPAQGNELAVLAAPIGEGETVWLEVEVCGSDAPITTRIPLSATPVVMTLEDISRYRVVKDCSGAAAQLPTTVEMILNGSAST